LDQILWLRCGSKLENAFKATDLLLQGGGFSLVLLDLSDVPAEESRRIISSWWYRFRRVVEDTPTVLVVMAQDSCVRSCASLTLQTTCAADDWNQTAADASIPSGAINPGQSRRTSTTLVVQHTSHTRLFKGLRLQLHRQKPMNLNNPGVRFAARIHTSPSQP
jgi:hypothetical protein